jgi:hypothetical protein
MPIAQAASPMGIHPAPFPRLDATSPRTRPVNDGNSNNEQKMLQRFGRCQLAEVNLGATRFARRERLPRCRNVSRTPPTLWRQWVQNFPQTKEYLVAQTGRREPEKLAPQRLRESTRGTEEPLLTSGRTEVFDRRDGACLQMHEGLACQSQAKVPLPSAQIVKQVLMRHPPRSASRVMTISGGMRAHTWSSTG